MEYSLSKWLQSRDDQKKKELDIISDTLKFLFSTRQIYNNLVTEKLVFEKMRHEFPEKTSELERKIYERFDKEIEKDFFPQLMFHSFQLKRLEDESFLNGFQKIMMGYEELGKAILGQATQDIISKLNTEVMNSKKLFIEKCQTKT